MYGRGRRAELVYLSSEMMEVSKVSITLARRRLEPPSDRLEGPRGGSDG